MYSSYSKTNISLEETKFSFLFYEISTWKLMNSKRKINNNKMFQIEGRVRLMSHIIKPIRKYWNYIVVRLYPIKCIEMTLMMTVIRKISVRGPTNNLSLSSISYFIKIHVSFAQTWFELASLFIFMKTLWFQSIRQSKTSLSILTKLKIFL